MKGLYIIHIPLKSNLLLGLNYLFTLRFLSFRAFHACTQNYMGSLATTKFVRDNCLHFIWYIVQCTICFSHSRGLAPLWHHCSFQMFLPSQMVLLFKNSQTHISSALPNSKVLLKISRTKS